MAGKLTNKKAVEDLARKGDRLGAMKEDMAQARAGLKESKDALDRMMEQLGTKPKLASWIPEEKK